MLKVELTERAKRDLDLLAAQSLKIWGRERTRRYLREIAVRLADLRRTRLAPPLMPNPDYETVVSTRVGRHVIHLVRGTQTLTVVAVLHERMDQEARLRDRLG